jgi:hypothetical protein
MNRLLMMNPTTAEKIGFEIGVYEKDKKFGITRNNRGNIPIGAFIKYTDFIKILSDTNFINEDTRLCFNGGASVSDTTVSTGASVSDTTVSTGASVSAPKEVKYECGCNKIDGGKKRKFSQKKNKVKKQKANISTRVIGKKHPFAKYTRKYKRIKSNKRF